MSKELRELFEQLRNAQDKATTIMNRADVNADEIKASTSNIQTIKAKIEAQKAIDEGKIFDESGVEITNEPDPIKVIDKKGENMKCKMHFM